MVLEFFIGAVDYVMAPLAIFPPYAAILIVSAMITSIIIIVNRLIVNKKFIDQIRLRMEQLKESITQAQKDNDKENLQKFVNELMQVNGNYMKHSFKMIIASLVIVSIFLPWLGFKYAAASVGIPFSLPFIGEHLTWLYWYVLVSFLVGWLARKLFGAGL